MQWIFPRFPPFHIGFQKTFFSEKHVRQPSEFTQSPSTKI